MKDSKKTERISTAEAASRINRSKRYTLKLLAEGRIKGAETLGNGSYVITVKTGEAPEIHPPLKKRHKP